MQSRAICPICRKFHKGRGYCLVCKRKKSMQHQQVRTDKEAQKFYQSWAWRKTRKVVIERDKGVCQHCKEAEGKEVDHVIPRTISNDDSIGNLQLLCKACHTIKTNKERNNAARFV